MSCRCHRSNVSGVAIVAMSRKARRPTAVGPCGQPSAIIIGQAHAPGAQLAAEAPVLFDQIDDDLPFPAGQPAGQDHQQQLECGGVDHGPQLISRPGSKASEDVG